MNAIPQKPLEADPAARRDGKPPSDTEAEDVRLTIDFEDDPEDNSGSAAGAWATSPEDSDTQASRTIPKGSASAEPARAQATGPNADGRLDPQHTAEIQRAAEAQHTGAAAADQPQGSAARRRTAPQSAHQSERHPGSEAGATQASASTDHGLTVPPQLAGIEVTLTVEIGSHRLPLKDLLSIDPGQLFALDRMTSEPVSILVNGKPFAQGEIVAIGDRFGVRLLDIVEPKAS